MAKDPRPKSKRRKPWSKLAPSTRRRYLLQYSKKKLKPKGKRGKIAVKRLGRTYKTGGFEAIAEEAAKRYGSKERGKRVAAAVYWRMVRKRGG